MAANLPENYNRFPDAFRFIQELAVDWDDTKVLEAEPGDYITIARKAKETNNWFIGNTSDENDRLSQIKLDFLDAGKKYTATLYADAADAHYERNQQSYTITRMAVTCKSALKLKAAPGGGFAISILEVPAIKK